MKVACGLAAAMAIFMAFGLGTSGGAEEREHVRIGSKAFPESWILGEALRNLAAASGADARHAENLGGTEIAYDALASGEIDAYPEYTGTISEVLVHGPADAARVRVALAVRGLAESPPLGFDDAYGLAMTRAAAARLGVTTISDLAGHPELRFGLTHEFLGRADGFSGVAASYGLAPKDVRAVQHELGLEALGRGQLDVVDVYTTDPQIDRFDLRVLRDDRGFFRRYDAVVLYRADLPVRAPHAFAAMSRIVGRVDAKTMRRANARVALEHASVDDAARGLLADALGVDAALAPRSWERGAAVEIARDTARHLELVLAALVPSVLVGVPLGVLAARSRRLGAVIAAASVLQAVPSLALLGLLVPLLGIGVRPALAALFLYGLLPIVRSTHTGLTTIPPSIVEAAEAIGLSPRARLMRVLVPMASPHILGGVRTSAVIAIGTATLAALIGAGGLGDPILEGITLHDTARVLEGAIPAASLALAVEAAFAGLAVLIVPRGLREGRRGA